MHKTGMYRKLDEVGRIVIPIEMREKLNLQTNDKVSIYLETEDETIHINKATENNYRR